MTCSEREVHYNDIGTVFLITVNDCVSGTSVALDLSTASSLQVILKSPSGVSYTKTASFYTNGTDGKIVYVTINNDLNEVGTWSIQAKITIPTGTFRSDIGTFKVYENL
jgi:hypothetical protein